MTMGNPITAGPSLRQPRLYQRNKNKNNKSRNSSTMNDLHCCTQQHRQKIGSNCCQHHPKKAYSFVLEDSACAKLCAPKMSIINCNLDLSATLNASKRSSSSSSSRLRRRFSLRRFSSMSSTSSSSSNSTTTSVTTESSCGYLGWNLVGRMDSLHGNATLKSATGEIVGAVLRENLSSLILSTKPAYEGQPSHSFQAPAADGGSSGSNNNSQHPTVFYPLANVWTSTGPTKSSSGMVIRRLDNHKEYKITSNGRMFGGKVLQIAEVITNTPSPEEDNDEVEGENENSNNLNLNNTNSIDENTSIKSWSRFVGGSSTKQQQQQRTVPPPTLKPCGSIRHYFERGCMTKSRWEVAAAPGLCPSMLTCIVAIINKSMGQLLWSFPDEDETLKNQLNNNSNHSRSTTTSSNTNNNNTNRRRRSSVSSPNSNTTSTQFTLSHHPPGFNTSNKKSSGRRASSSRNQNDNPSTTQQQHQQPQQQRGGGGTTTKRSYRQENPPEVKLEYCCHRHPAEGYTFTLSDCLAPVYGENEMTVRCGACHAAYFSGWHVKGRIDALGGNACVMNEEGEVVTVVNHGQQGEYFILSTAPAFPGQAKHRLRVDKKKLYYLARIRRQPDGNLLIFRYDTQKYLQAKDVATDSSSFSGTNRFIRMINKSNGETNGYVRHYFQDGDVAKSRWEVAGGSDLCPTMMMCVVAIINKCMGRMT